MINTPGGGTKVPDINMSAFNDGWIATGAGEPGSAAIAGAIANAFFDATGVRLREAPMTPSRVRGVLQAAGIKA